MILPIILVGSIVILLFVYILGNSNERYWKKRGVKFYTKNKVFGVFWDFFMIKGALFERFADIYKEFKNEPAVGIGSLLTPSLVVIHPKNIQHVFQGDFNSFYHRGVDISKGDNLSDNILFMNGPRWKLMRQNMTPLFTANKLKNMYYIMDKSAQDFVTYLKENPKKWEGDCYQTLMTFCSAALCGAIFGISSESIFDSPFLKVAKDITASTFIKDLKFAALQVTPKLANLVGLKIFDQYEDFMVGAVKNVMETRKKENIKRHDFADLAITIQNNGTMRDPTTGTELDPTYELLTAQAMFFLIAGVEPVAVAIFCSLIEVGRNPDILRKLHQEIDENFEKHGNKLTYEHISEMTYVDEVLSEAMRKNPPIGVLTRQCVKDGVLPVGNIKVQKGTRLIAPVYQMQNDPEIYPEPHVFNPERFADGCKLNDDFYMPFGMGGRMCIGARYSKLQMAAGLVHLLRHFTVKTKEIRTQQKFKRHTFAVTPIDADVELIPRGVK